MSTEEQKERERLEASHSDHRTPSPPESPLSNLETLDLDIEKLVAGGDGLGRHAGIPIFVPRSAPGDRVRIRLVEKRPDYGRGEIMELLAAGPGRRDAPCPYFEHCGGCDLQHLEDDKQLELKVAAAQETLERLGGISPPYDLSVISGDAWGYRLRAQLQARAGEEGQRAAVGFFARRSHDFVPVGQCPVLVPEIDGILPQLARELAEVVPRRLDIAAGEDGAVSLSPVVEGLPHGELRIRVGEFSYRFDPRCFFQAHRGLLERFVEAAVGSWTGERAVDLYAGVGLFSLPLAAAYDGVTAVEGDRIASRYARLNAKDHRLAGMKVITSAVESWIPHLPKGLDRVLLNPPRDGLSAKIRVRLREHKPKRITYVSCHPATLARDLKHLVVSHRIESICFADLFPQTGHIETIVQMVPS